MGWTIRLTNNGQFDGQVQVTIRKAAVILVATSISVTSTLRDKPHLYPWGKSSGDGECQLGLGGDVQSPQLFGQLQVTGVISTATLCRLICNRASLRSTLRYALDACRYRADPAG